MQMYEQRPEIIFLFEFLDWYLLSPSIDQWVAIKKIVWYLQKINGCENDIKFIYRYNFMLIGGAISWKNMK